MSRNPPKDPLIIILGASGTGKSQLAVDLAIRLNGEIVNGDAMQMYDALPIITNKMTLEERRGIPHHLLGFISLTEEPWTIALFKMKAGQIITEIRSRGRLPIVVGGTHYYTQSLLWEDAVAVGLDNDEANMSSQQLAKRYPILEGRTEAMVERLKEIDPVMATRWHPNDRRKIRRSLEIYLTTGKKASEIYAEQNEPVYLRNAEKAFKICGEQNRPQSARRKEDGVPLSNQLSERLDSTLLFWVHTESEILKTRLDARVDKMLEAGLLSEVNFMNSFLHEQDRLGVTVDRTRGIWASIGFKEFSEYLSTLEASGQSPLYINTVLRDAIEGVKAATRQYAKRQVRWIRLKLMHALSNGNALERLYLLDGTDISKWTSTVSGPAIAVTEKFLAGSELPPPEGLSAAAGEVLRLSDLDKVVRHECDICGVITVTEQQWQTHLKSRRHRGSVKKRAKDEASSRSHGVNSNGGSGAKSP